MGGFPGLENITPPPQNGQESTQKEPCPTPSHLGEEAEQNHEGVPGDTVTYWVIPP